MKTIYSLGSHDAARQKPDAVSNRSRRGCQGAMDDAGSSLRYRAAYSPTPRSRSSRTASHRGKSRCGMALREFPIVNLENACASAVRPCTRPSTIFAPGPEVCSRSLEKCTAPIGQIRGDFRWRLDVHESAAVAQRCPHARYGRSPVAPGRAQSFHELYAALAKGHMKRFGTTDGRSGRGGKNHRHSTMNRFRSIEMT